ncbi:MAG: hypothetical protein QF497_15360, partial [Verrucomicrobiota bacterium]|nr:hypothetical protein [Verrucomicrobiota bacterium]
MGEMLRLDVAEVSRVLLIFQAVDEGQAGIEGLREHAWIVSDGSDDDNGADDAWRGRFLWGSCQPGREGTASNMQSDAREPQGYSRTGITASRPSARSASDSAEGQKKPLALPKKTPRKITGGVRALRGPRIYSLNPSCWEIHDEDRAEPC